MCVILRRAVAEARDLHDQIDRARDLLADGAHAHVGVGHADHDFQARHAVARRVGVNGGERAVVTGIHGLKHVQRFFAADFADDDAVGPHTEGVDDQIANLDGAVAFDVGGPRFHARHVRLAQPQFGGVFDGDDALVFRNVARKHVQQRGLTGAGAAGDHDVQARAHARFEQFQHALGQRQSS